MVLRSVEFWDPTTRLWKTLACLPFAVSKHGLVVSGQGKMYMAGGEYPDGSASRAVWRYDPVLNAWQEMADMRVPRSELGLAMLDGCVYAVGGWEGTSRLDSVERWVEGGDGKEQNVIVVSSHVDLCAGMTRRQTHGRTCLP